MSKRVFYLSLVFVFTLIVSAFSFSGSTKGNSFLNLSAVADAYISSSSPGVNYGTALQLKVTGPNSNQGENISFIKFDIPELSAEIENVKLKMYVYRDGNGLSISLADNSWLENTINYQNAPETVSEEPINYGSLSKNTWIEVDVTEFVDAAGEYSFRVETSGNNIISLGGRENGNVPQLIVELVNQPSPTPDPSIVPTETPTPTPEPSVEPSPSPSPEPSETPTPTPDPTPTETPTPSPTPTPEPSPSVTPTPEPTPTQTPEPTPTPTPEPSVEPSPTPTPSAIPYYFPPIGQSVQYQSVVEPEDVGLDEAIVGVLNQRSGNWALWRYGHLVNVTGGFNDRHEVKSLRKTWHALTVGAAIGQGKISNYNQPISTYETDLTGKDANATWWHVMTQSSSFGYPGCSGDMTDYDPGQMWTYSDLNPYRLNNALAKVYGKSGYTDNYSDVLKQAYFDAIGMSGWGTKARPDGIRLMLDLEDMGRLGLLMITRGQWNGQQIIPSWFIEEQESKQTTGMAVNYVGCGDGSIGLDPQEFPESPYGFMTWTNDAGNYYPGASTEWAWGWGAGGYYVLWNADLGIVFAGTDIAPSDTLPSANAIPHLIEVNLLAN